MQEYKIEDIAHEAVARLYKRKGKHMDSKSFVRLQEWYEDFIHKVSMKCDWQSKVLEEVYDAFEVAYNYDVLSTDFRERVSSALALGCAYLKRFSDTEDEYFNVFVERLTYLCGIISGYILVRDLESKSERLKIAAKDFEGDFCMDVHGVYPADFLNEGILIVGVVRTGIIHTGDFISMPCTWDYRDYGQYNEFMVKSVGEVIEVAMFGRRMTEVRAGDVCVLSVKYGGMLMKDDEFSYPFHIYHVEPIPDIRMASEEVREKEYADEYISRHSWDNTTLALTVPDRMYMETVRTTLNISENRAREIEGDCASRILPKKYLDCFEAVRECLSGMDD